MEKLKKFFKGISSDSWSYGVIFGVIFGMLFDWGILGYVGGFIMGMGMGIDSQRKKKENSKD